MSPELYNGMKGKNSSIKNDSDECVFQKIKYADFKSQLFSWKIKTVDNW